MRFFLIFIFIFIFIFFFLGCTHTISVEESKEKIETTLGVSIPSIEKVENLESGFSIMGDDYMESFVVFFEKQDFQDLLNKVNPRKSERSENLSFLTKKGDRSTTSIMFNDEECSLTYTYIFE